MNLLFGIVGIFAGIAVCMGTLYSLAQVILTERWVRRAHLFALGAMLLVMWFLLERDVALARLFSPLLLLACIATFLVERRWFRLFPILQAVFAVLLLGGYVHF